MKEELLATDPWAGFIPISVRKPDPVESISELILLDDLGHVYIGDYMHPGACIDPNLSDRFYGKIYSPVNMDWVPYELKRKIIAWKLFVIPLPDPDLFMDWEKFWGKLP
jgi:hypothetical protein